MATVVENFNNDPRNKVRAKINAVGEKLKDLTVKTLVWAQENKEISVPLALGLGGLIFDRSRQHSREVRAKKELETRLRTVYDRHTGITYYMNRVPKSKQQRLINQRLQNNEPIGDILEDLGLL